MQDNEKKPALRFKGFTDPWEQRKLEEYLEVSGQKNFEGIYTKEDVLSVSGDFGIVNQIEFQGRSFAGASVANYGVVETGDIVYTKSPLKSNPYGIIKANKGKNGIVSTLYAVYKPKQSANPEFVQIYFEQDARMNNYMHPLVNKGAKNDMKVSAENALKGQIVFPDIKEQRTISEFFHNLDTLITLHQRKYEKLVNIKKSMLDKMFPKNGASVPEIRFKGFTDPWEQRKLGDITVELSEYATQELGLPLLTSSRSGLMYQDEYRDSRTTKSTETLFSVVPVGTCTYRHMSDDDVFHMNINTLEKGLVSREYPVFEASTGNNLEFLVQHIKSSEEFKAFCAEQKKGGTRTRLYYNTLCQFTVRVPALKEQAQISQCLKKLDTLITLHQREHIKPILEVKRVKRNE